MLGDKNEIRPNATQIDLQNEAEEILSEPVSQEPQQAPVQSVGSFLWEVIKFTILAVVIVVPIRVYIAQPYIVSGSSMYPTFENGQYLIVDQISYRFENPMRGDVIIFRFPQDPSKFFIKRIIGLPGESVRSHNGTVTTKTPGEEAWTTISEEYLPQTPTDNFEVTLADDEYFVMGDNRGASLDSRVWGNLPEKFIVGKVFLRLLPVTKAGVWPGGLL